MRIDRRFVFEETRFIGAVRDGHDVDLTKLRSAFSPVTMGENMMPPNLAARFNFASRRPGSIVLRRTWPTPRVKIPFAGIIRKRSAPIFLASNRQCSASEKPCGTFTVVHNL